MAVTRIAETEPGPGAPAAAPAIPSPVATLLRGYSVEITARSKTAVEACRDHLDPGTQVYVAAIPGDGYHKTVATAAQLAKAGFVPTPHIAARGIASFAELDDLLLRLRGEAGVGRALVIGGDTEHARGPYESSLALLETGAFQKRGITRVGIACYPEAPRRLDASLLEPALMDKAAFLQKEGFDAWLVSQFCFDAVPIIALAQRLRGLGIALPLHVGLTGPADARTMWKYALHCGIGNSVRFLGARTGAIGNLMARHTPDPILGGLDAAHRAEPGLGLAGVHFFTFGGIAATAEWARGVVTGQRPE